MAFDPERFIKIIAKTSRFRQAFKHQNRSVPLAAIRFHRHKHQDLRRGLKIRIPHNFLLFEILSIVEDRDKNVRAVELKHFIRVLWHLQNDKPYWIIEYLQWQFVHLQIRWMLDVFLCFRRRRIANSRAASSHIRDAEGPRTQYEPTLDAVLSRDRYVDSGCEERMQI